MVVSSARFVALAILAWAGTAHAIQQVRSLYTAIDLPLCAAVAGQDTARLCKGLPGYPVYIAEGAEGVFVSVGPDPDKRRAVQQTLKSFNTLFDKSGQRATVEWRFVIRNAQPVPYATIIRYFTRGAGGAGEVLVVMRVTDRDTCHAAYVDAAAGNADAIVLARKLADTVARSQDCPPEPMRVTAVRSGGN